MEEARKIVREIIRQEASKVSNTNSDVIDDHCNPTAPHLSASKPQLIEQNHAWLGSILAKPSNLRAIIREASANLYRTLLMDTYFAFQRHKKSHNVNRAHYLGLFKRILERFFVNEKLHNSNFDLIGILKNKPFIRSLGALSLEICMFSSDSTSCPFKDLLRISRVSALNFWKNLGNFGSLFTEIPQQLKLHLKEIESKILLNLVWKENWLPGDLTFYNRLLTLVAYRTKVFCDAVGLSTAITERVWDMLKFILPQKPSLFPSRSIEDLLVCSVFMVCRLNCEVPLSNLLRKYYETFYRSDFYLLNENPTLAELNEFFNTEFVLEMKDYVLRNQTAPSEVPIPELCSSESLEVRTRGLKVKGKGENVLGRTEQLWALNR